MSTTQVDRPRFLVQTVVHRATLTRCLERLVEAEAGHHLLWRLHVQVTDPWMLPTSREADQTHTLYTKIYVNNLLLNIWLLLHTEKKQQT